MSFMKWATLMYMIVAVFDITVIAWHAGYKPAAGDVRADEILFGMFVLVALGLMAGAPALVFAWVGVLVWRYACRHEQRVTAAGSSPVAICTSPADPSDAGHRWLGV